MQKGSICILINST